MGKSMGDNTKKASWRRTNTSLVGSLPLYGLFVSSRIALVVLGGVLLALRLLVAWMPQRRLLVQAGEGTLVVHSRREVNQAHRATDVGERVVERDGGELASERGGTVLLCVKVYEVTLNLVDLETLADQLFLDSLCKK